MQNKRVSTKEQHLRSLVNNYLSHPRRRRFIHLSRQVLKKLKDTHQHRLLTPLREYLLKTGIVKTERAAYIHAHMLDGHVYDIIDGLAPQKAAKSRIKVTLFENKAKREDAKADFQSFLMLA